MRGRTTTTRIIDKRSAASAGWGLWCLASIGSVAAWGWRFGSQVAAGEISVTWPQIRFGAVTAFFIGVVVRIHMLVLKARVDP